MINQISAIMPREIRINHYESNAITTSYMVVLIPIYPDPCRKYAAVSTSAAAQKNTYLTT